MPFDVCCEIDELLDGLSRLAASGVRPEEFYHQLLVQGIREAEAVSGAIWAGRDCLMERDSTGKERRPSSDEFGNVGRLRLLDRVISRGASESSIVEQANKDGSTCRLLCVIAPFFVEQYATGGIELHLPIEAHPSAHDRALHLAEAFAELIGDYYCRNQLVHFRQREVHWKSLSRFVDGIHRSGLHETAIAVANEGRWFSGCDRVSVICRRKGTCKVLAVSGVDRTEPRSNLVARMEQLASAVLKTNEALWEIAQPAQRAHETEQPLQNYLAESHSRALVALPLISRDSSAATSEGSASSNGNGSQPQGVLMLEWFTAPTIDEAARERIELVARHGASALEVALDTERLPFIACNRALAKIGWLISARRLSAKLWAVGILAALLLALVAVPADFEIAADGELQPLARREIFAPADAVVDLVLVEHGDAVAAGQPLLRLRSAAIDFDTARLRGEIQTAEKRLAAIRSARLERNEAKPGPAHRHLQLSAEEEELKESLASLRRQEQLVDRQRDELEVRSPLDGQVLTWDVARALAARPVERGQSLLSVGDVAGRWSLELAVPDEQIGSVLTAAEQARQGGVTLPVSFLLVAEPGVAYRGYVERISQRGQLDEKSGQPVVQVIVRLDDVIENPRPGAGVVAKIDCGRRSLGFVWLHDTWNSVRRRLLF